MNRLGSYLIFLGVIQNKQPLRVHGEGTTQCSPDYQKENRVLRVTSPCLRHVISCCFQFGLCSLWAAGIGSGCIGWCGGQESLLQNTVKIVSLHSAFIRPHLDIASSFGLPIQEIQGQTGVLEHLPFEVRLGELLWVSLENEWPQGLLTTSTVPIRCHQGGRVGLFRAVRGGRTRENGHKLKQEKFRLGIRRKIFPTKTVRKWNWLSWEVMQSLVPLRFSTADWTKSWGAMFDLRVVPALRRKLD